MPGLTPAQVLSANLRNDRRNIRDLQHEARFELICRVIADCAVRLLQALHVDAQVGGSKFQQQAMKNLRSAALKYADLEGEEDLSPCDYR